MFKKDFDLVKTSQHFFNNIEKGDLVVSYLA